MEETSPTTGAATRADKILQTLHRQRDELGQFLAAQRRRLSDAKDSLHLQSRQIADELDEERRRIQRADEQSAARGEQLAREAEQIAQLKQDFETARAEWRETQDRATAEQRQWAERLQATQESLAQSLGDLLDRQTRLTEEAMRPQPPQEESPPDKTPVESNQEAELIERLCAERDALVEQLVGQRERVAQIQRQLDEALAAGLTDKGGDRLHHRAAQDEINKLKSRNEELEKQLAKIRDQGSGVDWEVRKQRLLASLEEMEDDDAEATARRTRFEEIIETTSATIAVKDQQIAELRQMLDARVAAVPPPKGGETGQGQVAFRDAAMEEERERLRKLQEEFEQKIRQAEIEIAIERAEIARQQIEVEEIVRQFASERPVATPADIASGKSSGRRWLDRLGLKNTGEDAAG